MNRWKNVSNRYRGSTNSIITNKNTNVKNITSNDYINYPTVDLTVINKDYILNNGATPLISGEMLNRTKFIVADPAITVTGATWDTADSIRKALGGLTGSQPDGYTFNVTIANMNESNNFDWALFPSDILNGTTGTNAAYEDILPLNSSTYKFIQTSDGYTVYSVIDTDDTGAGSNPWRQGQDLNLHNNDIINIHDMSFTNGLVPIIYGISFNILDFSCNIEQGHQTETTLSGDYLHAEGYLTTASGDSAHAEGYSTIAYGIGSHAEGYDTSASGIASHAEGSGNVTYGIASHAEGYQTTASGDYSHAEGYDTMTSHAAFSGIGSHAEGYDCSAIGDYSHTEGYQTTTVQGTAPHAEGYNTIANNIASHAEGSGNIASGNASHVEGYGNITYVAASHAEGNQTTTYGTHSHAEGSDTSALGPASHAEGKYTIAFGNYSHVEGSGNVTYGIASHAEGYQTTASGDYSHAEGYDTSASGIGSHAEGKYTIASGDYSHAEGQDTSAIGDYSHAEGYLTTASGDYSHVEGYDCSAIGDYSHVEGHQTTTFGDYSHTEGQYTIANGDYSHAEGHQTTASGDYSHAEGRWASASGDYSHAEGYDTSAIGIASHSEGRYTTATGDYSHAEGSGTVTWGLASHAEGKQTNAQADYTHAEGYLTNADGDYSHAEGSGNITYGIGSHAEGYNTTASGEYSHAEGYNTTVSGDYSHAEGYNTTASGDYSHAEGYLTTASGDYSHAEGWNTSAEQASHAEGSGNIASGIASHVEGHTTTATGTAAHAEGNLTNAYGSQSHAEGYDTSAIGIASHSEGRSTVAYDNYMWAGGQFNIDTNPYDSNVNFVVGAGTSTGNRKDAFVILESGDSSFNGTVQIDGCLNVMKPIFANKKIVRYTNDYVLANSSTPTISAELMYNNDIIKSYLGTEVTGAIWPSALDISAYFGHKVGNTFDVTIANVNDTSFVWDNFSETGDLSYTFGPKLESIAKKNTATYKFVQINDSSYQIYPIINPVALASAGSNIELPTNVFTTDLNLNVSNIVDTSNIYFSNDAAITGLNANILSLSGAIEQGYQTTVTGDYAHAEGQDTIASGDYSHAEGRQTEAIGDYSHAEGFDTSAVAIFSHTEGYGTTASGDYSHAEGAFTSAIGTTSHAEGRYSIAMGTNSHAEGQYSIAIGTDSHAEGYDTSAIGIASHSEGKSTVAYHDYMWVGGQYNKDTNPYDVSINFVIGAGTGTSDRKDAFVITASGDSSFNGSVQIDGCLNITNPIFGKKVIGYTDVTNYELANNATPTISAELMYNNTIIKSGSTGVTGAKWPSASEIFSYFGNKIGNTFDVIIANVIDTSFEWAEFSETGDLSWAFGPKLESIGYKKTNIYKFLQINDSSYQIYPVVTPELGDWEVIFPPKELPTNVFTTDLSLNVSNIVDVCNISFSNGMGISGENLPNKLKLVGDGVFGSEGSNLIHGNNNTSAGTGDATHAEGFGTDADAEYSHAEGVSTTTTSRFCHTEGFNSTTGTDGTYSFACHVEGVGGHADGDTQPSYAGKVHVEGLNCKGLSSFSHAEGNNTVTYQEWSHSEGYDTSTNAQYSHAEGRDTRANYAYSHAEGYGTDASDQAAHTEGWGSVVSAFYSHAEGFECSANSGAGWAHAEGYQTHCGRRGSHTEGYQTNIIDFGGSANHVHAEGWKTTINTASIYSHVEGRQTTATGDYSHAEGQYNITIGTASHAEGYNTTGAQSGTHAEGYNTSTTSSAAHSEGYNTSAELQSHCEGSGNNTSAGHSHAEGEGVVADADDSHCEGQQTNTYFRGKYSHCEGYRAKIGTGSTAWSHGAHCEGYDCSVYGDKAHAEGWKTTINTDQDYGHAEGYNTTVNSHYSHAEGRDTSAVGTYSHAEGSGNVTDGLGSHAEGDTTIASGDYSHVEGSGNITYGLASHAEGYQTNASGDYSHAEGYLTIAGVDYSHAEGYDCSALSDYSHAEGEGTTAYSIASHAEGSGNITSHGDYSHAEGANNFAIGIGSHVEGSNNIASGLYSHAEGELTNLPEISGGFLRARGLWTNINSNGDFDIYMSFDFRLGRNGIALFTNPVAGAGDHDIPLSKLFTDNNYTGTFKPSINYLLISSGNFTPVGKYNIPPTKFTHVCTIPSSYGVTTLVWQSGMRVYEYDPIITFGLDRSNDFDAGEKYFIGDYSHAQGLGTYAYDDYMWAGGKYNVFPNPFGANVRPYDVSVNFVVGAGTSNSDRKDAFLITASGDVSFNGDVKIGEEPRVWPYNGNLTITGVAPKPISLNNIINFDYNGQVDLYTYNSSTIIVIGAAANGTIYLPNLINDGWGITYRFINRAPLGSGNTVRVQCGSNDEYLGKIKLLPVMPGDADASPAYFPPNYIAVSAYGANRLSISESGDPTYCCPGMDITITAIASLALGYRKWWIEGIYPINYTGVASIPNNPGDYFRNV